MKILVIGSNGMLGHEVFREFQQHGFDVVGTQRTTTDKRHLSNVFQLDLTAHKNTVIETIENLEPDVVINCAGILKPISENDRTVTVAVNSLAPHIIAKACDNLGKKMIQVSTDCFVPTTKILTDKGYTFIEEIKIGDLVFTHTGNLESVKEVKSRNHEGKIYHIKAMGADTFSCTENHPFYVVKHQTKDKFNPEWILTKNLKINDFIAVPKLKKTKPVPFCVNLLEYSPKHKQYYEVIEAIKKCDKRGDLIKLSKKINVPYWKVFNWKQGNHRPTQRIQTTLFKVDKDIAWLFGVFVAEGWVQTIQNRNCIYFCFGDEPELISKTVRILKEKFGLDPTLKKLKGQKGTQVIVYDLMLAKFFEKEFYLPFTKAYCYNLKIPAFIEALTEEQKLAFLKGYYDGDGCYYENEEGDAFLSFNSVSETFIDQLKIFFNRQEVYAYKSKINCPNNIILGRKVNVRQSYKLVVSGLQLKKILPYLEDTFFSLDNHPHYQKFFEDPNYWYVPIKKIEQEDYSGVVYNMEVENDHSYLINGGLATHNCVFNGGVGQHTEEDIPDPVDFYGTSKLAGEVTYGKHLTIRTSILGREWRDKKYNLLDWFLTQLDGSKLNGFVDHVWNGVTTTELAKLLVFIVTKKPDLNSLIHVPGQDVTKYDLLCLFKEVYGKNVEILRHTSGNYCDRTLRSVFFDNLNYKIPPLKEQLMDLKMKNSNV